VGFGLFFSNEPPKFFGPKKFSSIETKTKKYIKPRGFVLNTGIAFENEMLVGERGPSNSNILLYTTRDNEIIKSISVPLCLCGYVRQDRGELRRKFNCTMLILGKRQNTVPT